MQRVSFSIPDHILAELRKRFPKLTTNYQLCQAAFALAAGLFANLPEGVTDNDIEEKHIKYIMK